MLHTSFVAVLLSLELVSQSPGKASSWVVVQSQDGDFSFSMPGKPHEQTNDISSPNGPVKMKVYIYTVQDAALIVHLTPLPAPVPPNMVPARLDAAKKSASPNLPKLVAEKRISAGNVPGIELIHSGPTGQDKRNRTVKVHMFIKGSNAYSMIVAAVPDRPLPPEADLFFDSVRFGGEPAVISGPKMAAKPAAAAPPVKRKPIAKIDLVDKTPEDAYRTFMMAVFAADEKTLRAVTLPATDFDVLLAGEEPPIRSIKEMKQMVLKIPLERLKVGDLVKLPRNKSMVIRANEVGPDRAVLLGENEPIPWRLRRVDGHWKVDPAPLIAGRKAAQKAVESRNQGDGR
jgi:hypothetical protein